MEMIEVIRDVEDYLKWLKKNVYLPKPNHPEILHKILDLTRLEQFVSGPIFKTTFLEVLRDYCKTVVKTGDVPESLMSSGTTTPSQLLPNTRPESSPPVLGKVVDLPPRPSAVVTVTPSLAAVPTTATVSEPAVVIEQAVASVFICKKCSQNFEHFPATGKCACGNGSFRTVDAPKPSEEHKEFCREMERDLVVPKTQPIVAPLLSPAPVPAPVLEPQAAPVVPPSPSTQESGLLTVLSKQFWACDNASCGSDDLVHEVPVPPPDKHQVGSRYQCLDCGAVGKILLQWDELVALRGGSQVVAFKIGKDDYKKLKSWRDAPAPSETAVKAEPVKPPAPVSAPAIAPVVINAANTQPAPKNTRGRPKKAKEEVPAQTPESFQAPAAQAQTQVTLQAAVAAAPGIADLIKKIAGYESPQVDQTALAQEVQGQVKGWDMAKLLKEAETLTGQTIDITKMQVPPDKNVRQVLEDLVVSEMVGKSCGETAQ